MTGADVLQVIDWAQIQAGDRWTYAVALVYDDDAQEALTPGCGRGVVRLVGRDGNDHDPEDRVLVETQQQMLKRRSAALVVPEADQMPAGVPSVSPGLMSEFGAGQPPP